jgi:tryptophanase
MAAGVPPFNPGGHAVYLDTRYYRKKVNSQDKLSIELYLEGGTYGNRSVMFARTDVGQRSIPNRILRLPSTYTTRSHMDYGGTCRIKERAEQIGL